VPITDGVRDYEYGTPGEYRWLGCDGCGLVRLDPFPSSELLALAYPDTYHAYVEPASPISRKIIARSRAAVARRLARHLSPGATVLDVGCGNGALLAEIGKLGRYRLLGIEYSERAAATARSRGIEVWRGELSGAPFAVASVDLVCLQHVLEHVFDPIATLEKIAGFLKPGGRLLGEVPNLDSWDFRLFERTWGGGHAPRHLWHFTPATLQRALGETGFGQVSIRPALHTGHWALSVQNWLRRARRDTEGLVSGRAWYYPLLLLAAIPVNSVQMLVRKTGVIRFAAVRNA
jgi:SAM-dependent methyltransferase